MKKSFALCVICVFVATTAMAKEASEIYKTICSPCHGAKGEGKKPMGPSLKDSEFVKNGPDADVKNAIKNGVARAEKKYKDFPNPMPAHKALSDDELDSLIKFLKTEIAQ